ncbi:lactadherin-like [Patiria miniata]|uniref:F5/8 type C domain-containing protein n=1 Tax=Patiria miniata TaxID=46514 RepID=A0A914A9I1_PATMI|nr:lactadherin-like [Patiria miniata]
MRSHGQHYDFSNYNLDHELYDPTNKEVIGTFKDEFGAECSSPQPLGMEDGTIQDKRITASSSYSCCPASEARLDDNGWATSSVDANPWIEVDLVQSTVVSGVITQGDGRGTWYVKRYVVAYQKQPSSDYEHVNRNGDIKVFIGNTDGNTPVTNLD